MPDPTLQTPALPTILVDQSGNILTTLNATAAANTASNSLSGTITTNGATVAIPFIATARQEVINPSSATIWASWATPSVNGPGSFPIAPGGSFSTDRTTGTLTLISTTAAQPYTVNRYA